MSKGLHYIYEPFNGGVRRASKLMPPPHADKTTNACECGEPPAQMNFRESFFFLWDFFLVVVCLFCLFS